MFGLLNAVQAPFRKTNRNLLKLLVWFIKLIIMIALAFALIAFAAPIFWRHGYPFRNEAHSTYDIIELRPAE